MAVEHVLQPGDAGPAIGDADTSIGRRRGQLEATPAAARVLERVPRDLRDAGGEPGLLQPVEAEQRRDLTGPLPGEHDILLGADLGREDGGDHAVPAPRVRRRP